MHEGNSRNEYISNWRRAAAATFAGIAVGIGAGEVINLAAHEDKTFRFILDGAAAGIGALIGERMVKRHAPPAATPYPETQAASENQQSDV